MRNIILAILTIVSLPLFAQVSTPFPHREGQGGESLSLRQLTDSALKNNFATRAAHHNIEAAHEQRREAFTKYFPNVSATAATFNANRGMAKMTLDPQTMISPELGAALAQSFPPEAMAALAAPMNMTMMKSGVIASVTAMQPVFAGGQIVNGNRLARVGEEVSELQLQLAEQEVERTVSQYYWQLVSLYEKLATIDAVEALLADLHKDVDVAVRAGVAMRNDLLQVELRQNEVESQKVKLRNAIDIVKMTLGQYAGIEPSRLSPKGEGSRYSFEIDEPDLSQQDIPELPPLGREGVGLLPEYSLLQKQVEAAKLQKKMAVGKNLPSVAVGAGYNYHNLLDNDRTFAMVFATLSVPISDWWGGSHAVKHKKIELQKAQEQLEDNAQLLGIRLQKTWNDADEARQLVAIASRGIKQAEENLRLNRDYYRAGTSTMSNLLEAQLLYQQACDRHTEAYADLQHKLLLYRQAGGE
ncbi:MAG: TolC family protein [Prevotella sp.]|nr:TolC family protein [Prevotella sp.]